MPLLSLSLAARGPLKTTSATLCTATKSFGKISDRGLQTRLTVY